jgi:hypothetical protein
MASMDGGEAVTPGGPGFGSPEDAPSLVHDAEADRRKL